jgi:hypothetical protein
VTGESLAQSPRLRLTSLAEWHVKVTQRPWHAACTPLVLRCTSASCVFLLERVTRIELALSAWEVCSAAGLLLQTR